MAYDKKLLHGLVPLWAPAFAIYSNKKAGEKILWLNAVALKRAVRKAVAKAANN